MSEQCCKVLALPPDLLKCWPDCPGGGQITQVLAVSLKSLLDCPGGGQIAQALAILLKSLPDHSSTSQKGKLLTLSLPQSARSVKESDPVIPCCDLAALVRNDQ
jgi:hypothetical protein